MSSPLGELKRVDSWKKKRTCVVSRQHPAKVEGPSFTLGFPLEP